MVPWSVLCALILPVYPEGTSSEGGRPAVPLERMLRIYFLQLWFNLSDPAVEEALYDSAAMRSFAGIDLGREPVPDETTVCKFRHSLAACAADDGPVQTISPAHGCAFSTELKRAKLAVRNS